LIVSRLSDRRALVSGCMLLVGGVGLLALALGIESLAALIAAASVVGLGQGLVIGAGLAAINQRAPVEHRGETASSFFVVMYVGLSLPVIGVGVAAHAFSLRTAGIAFSAAVAALVQPPTPETAAIFFGVWKLGAILLSMSVLYGDEAIRHRLSDSGARLIVTDAANAARFDAESDTPLLVLDESTLAGAPTDPVT